MHQYCCSNHAAANICFGLLGLRVQVIFITVVGPVQNGVTDHGPRTFFTTSIMLPQLIFDRYFSADTFMLSHPVTFW